jgi:prepilin-type N-terminal cleavage/methylation domain-containing protein
MKKGFTLIELLIVIVIIGILAVIVVGLVATNSKARANDARKKAIMREVQTALEQYKVDNDVYPAALTDLYSNGNTYLSGAPEVIDTDAYTYTPANSNAEYALSVDMSQTGAKGPNVTNGVYTLNQKQ